MRGFCIEETANKDTFKSYVFFWVGQLFSILGSSITQFIIVWWLTIVYESPTILSLASFAYLLPLTIVFLIAGVITDRWNRKKIIIIADSLQAFVTLIIIILFNLEIVNPILIIIMNAFLGTFQGFHIPTVSAIVPTMIPKDKLSRMNGVNFLLTSFLQILAPIMSAMLLALFPIKIILWIDPITFLIALIPLFFIKIPLIKPEMISKKKNSFINDLKIGFKTLRLIPVVFMMLLIAMFVNFLMRPFSLLLPYFIYFNHSGTATDLAFVIAFLYGGMILGALISSIKKSWKHSVSIYFMGELIIMLTIGIFAVSPHGYFIYMAIVVAFYGLVIPIINTIYLTTMQLKVPADKMGRISSIDYALSMAISPIATILAGPLGELLGVPNLILYCSIIGIIIALIFWWITYLQIKNKGKNEFEIKEIKVDLSQTEI
ncbi:MAG: MFS transporter [Promethearchaeota archaeon]